MRAHEAYPKIPRLSRDCIITEKIDGTNAQIHIYGIHECEPCMRSADPCGLPVYKTEFEGESFLQHMLVGSRNRWITPEADNAGFARWCEANSEELLQLGPGKHFGEWWGSGIQRGYGLTKGDKRFSLFHTHGIMHKPDCVGVVPTLYEGLFTEDAVEAVLFNLRTLGSTVAPGFMDPEGIVIYHIAAKQLFKKTIKGDEAPKGKADSQ